MTDKPLCPECSAHLERAALVDSDDRIEASWPYCPVCGWDNRPKLRAGAEEHIRPLGDDEILPSSPRRQH